MPRIIRQLGEVHLISAGMKAELQKNVKLEEFLNDSRSSKRGTGNRLRPPCSISTSVFPLSSFYVSELAVLTLISGEKWARFFAELLRVHWRTMNH